MFNLVAMVLAGQGILTVSSRLVLTFARDRGIGPLSPLIAGVHPRLKAPVWCIIFVTIWVVAFGLISEWTYLPSSSRRAAKLTLPPPCRPVALAHHLLTPDLGSSVTTNAILSSSVVFLQISYFIPIAIVFVRGQSAFEGYDDHAQWSLGKWRRECCAKAGGNDAAGLRRN